MNRKTFTYQAIILALLLHAVALGVLNFIPYQKAEEKVEFIAVDFTEIEEMQEEKTLEEMLAERIEQNVANLVSDANAEQTDQRRNFISQRQQERIDQMVEAELKKLESETFEGLEEIRGNEEANNQADEVIPDQIQDLDSYDYYGKSYNGSVTGEVDVPGREVRYLHIPGYKCKGGGTVVLNISVDREGVVTEAEIDMTRSSFSGDCIPGEALNGALSSRFFVKSDAPKKSPGTITYRFIPQ